MRKETSEQLTEEDKAEALWNRLSALTPQPDPFCGTTHWQWAFHDAIDYRHELDIMHEGEGLVHFTRHPLDDELALWPIERHWLFGCNLLGPDALDVFELVLERETYMDTDLSPVIVSGLDPAGRLLAGIKARVGGRFRLEPFRKEVQCAASLSGGLDGFLSRRSGNFRRNLRRAAKRAAEDGVAFERHCPLTARQADKVFKRMLAVELTSWKGMGRCGMESPSMSRFYSFMLRRLARTGEGRVVLATQDRRDIGFIFGGMAGGVYRGQQFSFDESCAALSIGNLLQFEQIKWLCQEGAERYDLGPLLGPSMEYKYSWTEIQLPIEAWLITQA